MEKINNISISTYGLKLIKYQGILDMPKRSGEIVYNWGDELQPITTGIQWEGLDFTMDVVFDSRITSYTLDEAVYFLKHLGDCTLSTDYGDYEVVVREVKNVKTYNLVSTLTIAFYQRLPSFTASLATPTSGDITIDGFGLRENFGIEVVKIHPVQQAGTLQALGVTVFNTPQRLSELRQFEVLRLDCALAIESIQQLTEATQKLKALLSQEGLKKIHFDSNTYDAFFTEGIRFTFHGNAVKFSLVFWAVDIDASSLSALTYLLAYDKLGLTWESVGCTAESIRKAAGIQDGADALYFNYKAYNTIENLTWESPRCTYNSIL